MPVRTFKIDDQWWYTVNDESMGGFESRDEAQMYGEKRNVEILKAAKKAEKEKQQEEKQQEE